MKTKIEIKSIWGKLLFEFEKEDNSIKKTLLKAIKKGADLHGAKNLNPLYQSLLSLLKMQIGFIRAYKYLNGWTSPYKGFQYELGKQYWFDDFDPDPRKLCANGGNVGTLEWCVKDANKDLNKTYVEVEFPVKLEDGIDNICVPYASDGKFRVKTFTIRRVLERAEIEAAMQTMFPE